MKSRVARLIVGIVAAGVASAGLNVALATPASAAPLAGAGFVQASGTATETFEYSNARHYNSRSRTTTVTRTNTGVYEVRLRGLGMSGGVAHVTALGSGDTNCNIGGMWIDGEDKIVKASCFDWAGSWRDSRFTLTYTSVRETTGVDGHAYAVVDQASPTATYQPALRHNSRGAPINVTKQGTGYYWVSMGAMGSSVTSAQVTAIANFGNRCQVSTMRPEGIHESVWVRCFNYNGQPADTRFMITTMRRTNMLGRPTAGSGLGHHAAYAFSAAAYSNDTPTARWSSRTTMIPSIRRLSTGEYGLSFDQGISGGTVQVTATGTTGTFSNYCKIRDWSSTEVRVGCYNTSGGPADATFLATWTGKFV